MSTLPPLPKIDGDVDLMLDVYTHSSLRQAGVTRMNENYGDTLRLEDLGAKVLDLSVTVHLYNERPAMNTVEDMKASQALNGSGLSTVVDRASTDQENSIYIVCHHRFLAGLLRTEEQASHGTIGNKHSFE
jgi:hypothetical protein